eukprot:CAMPEP_0195056498 /NCGR_PEP_ID=MMETSP0448-20130528/4862_1 /TAXON_ID=66468 /ORGANISM="Heterocapsa triquestra, Strain CCMP 448" /LENGTH=390 /DNA_ID=CAMNT_0040086327 /DNA_START=66 /DNA_END=1234 /DNA_ORIENTATION=+
MSASASQPQDQFAQIDANHDGVISREEFYAAMGGAPVTYMQAPATTYAQGGMQYLAEPVATNAMQMTTVGAVPMQTVGTAPPVTMMAGPPMITTAEPVYMTAAAAEGMVYAAPAPVMTTAVTTAEPVYLTSPAVEGGSVAVGGSVAAPQMTEFMGAVPVATNMGPPVPMSSKGEVMMGGVTQMRIPAQVMRDDARSTTTSYAPTMSVTKEVGQAVYTAGPSTEEESAPQVTAVRTEQLVAGEVQQQVVEIPTVQIIEEIQEIPEIQVVRKIMEVPQVVQRMVEHIVEQEVHVPNIIPQKRITQQPVEMIVDVPVPMTQEEIVHVPTIVNQHRHHHMEVEQIVDIHVPHQQEEIIHVPKIIQQERIVQQHVEMIVEVPVPMVQEEIVHVPT